MGTNEIVTFGDLYGQGIKLRRRRSRSVPSSCQLPLANRVHDFNAGNRTPGGPKGFEAEHGTREPFHGSMVLLDDIIQILGVADHDSRLVRLIVVRNCCRVRAAFIDRDFLRSPWVRMALRKKVSAASRSRVGVSRKGCVASFHLRDFWLCSSPHSAVEVAACLTSRAVNSSEKSLGEIGDVAILFIFLPETHRQVSYS